MTLTTHHLSRRFGDRLAVDNASFSVERGRLTGFVGANGAGKTTVMRMILGVLAPSAGTVTLDGVELAQRKHEVLDLSALIRDVVADWVMLAIEKRIDLGFESTGPAMITGNPFLLRELAKNLIDNALRYTAAGGHVTCRVNANPHTVLFEVEDNGIGITEEQVKVNIFRARQTVKQKYNKIEEYGL